MKIFNCDHCNNPVYFENHQCVQCGYLLGYIPAWRRMVALNPSWNSWYLQGPDQQMMTYTFCANHRSDVCNWLVTGNQFEEFCMACELNRTIPSLDSEENFEKWRKLEVAKHRLIFQLERLGLPMESKMNNKGTGLCFDFISNEYAENETKVMTGHANGVITILLSEADSVHLEQMKIHLSEPYRTLIGHFRHEVGHYYWDRLVYPNFETLDRFRTLFGDEQADYPTALNTYYKEGARVNWQNYYISEYATSHPWEDWAETWAHYLHILDTLETAFYFGLSTNPNPDNNEILQSSIGFDPYEEKDFQRIVDSCIPIFFAINSINRSMGIPDIYPFVTNRAVIEKLKFIHRICISRLN